MRTMPFRSAIAVLLFSILLIVVSGPGDARAYGISYYHYVYATGGAVPEQGDGTLTDGPLSHSFSFFHVGEPLAPNGASVQYHADIDAGTVGAYASAVGGVTDFWPYGFTATGRVESIGFQLLVTFSIPAGEYPEGVAVSAAGLVTGSISATYAASAQGRYDILLGAGEHSTALIQIANDDEETITIDEPFLVTHLLVSPGSIVPQPTLVPLNLSAYFSNMQTACVREGTSPDYIIGSAADDFTGGIVFTEMIVPPGIGWSTDAGVFLNEEDISAAGETPGAAHLVGNHPNPFNPATMISWTLPASERVSLAVYDLAGRMVRVLVSGTVGEGPHTTTWDGLDDAGQEVPSGIYIYALEGEGFRESKKMMLVR